MKKTKVCMQQKITLFTVLALLISTSLLRAEPFGQRLFLQFKQQIQQQLSQSDHGDLFFSNSSSVNAPIAMPFAPCGGGTDEIGGSVFGDYNKNGLDDQIGSIEGVTVTYYACGVDGLSTLSGTAITDANGEFTLTGLTGGAKYRLEFTPPAGMDLTPGFSGDNGTDVQFITAPACNVKAAFSHPDDYCEDTGNPRMFSTCFVNADPFAAGSQVADEETIIYFDYQSMESFPSPKKLSLAGETGAVYGLAYAKSRNLLFTSAFAKRHVGLGPDNLGAIFAVDVSAATPDPTNATVTTLVNVNNIGIPVGTLPPNAVRGLGIDPASPSNDPDAYDAVGKRGIGAIVLSEDENTLWLTNLNDGLVYSIDLTNYYASGATPTAAQVTSFAINPASACSNGTLRPFAINVHRGEVYVGAVCDAANGTVDDLEAKVFRLNGSTFNEIATFDLNYTKGYAATTTRCEDYPGWYPWRSDIPTDACSGDFATSSQVFVVNPTPMLSGIEFDVNGDMMLGFMDRFGHQIGYRNYPLTGTTPLINTISGGDLLRAAYNFNTDTYTLESNGTAGSRTTAGAGNLEGPDGGEFYYLDIFAGGDNSQTGDNVLHRETSQGALAFYPGSGDIATTALDPYSTSLNTGGVNWFNNIDGTVRNDAGYRIYITVGSNSSTFQKANGLGEILIQCEEAAPIQIGTYLWDDINSNGVQDACESGIDNINVALYNAAGTVVATGMTTNGGQIYFDSRTTPEIVANTTYYLAYGTGGQFDTGAMTLSGDRSITTPNMGMGANADLNDSDVILADASVANGAITGLPYVAIAVGANGFVSHDADAGFQVQTGIGGEVWEDRNMDGIYDGIEFPIEGVTVILYNADDGMPVGSPAITSITGEYFFSNIPMGNYYIIFNPNTNTANVLNYQGTLQNQGDGTNDSDPDPTTGQTVDFPYNPANGIDTEFDAGYFEPITDLSGFVFSDNDEDGIQDVGDLGIEGVTVTLFDTNNMQVGQVTTNANGIYTFMNIPTGDYYIIFDPDSNTDNVPNYQGTLQDQGNDDTLDSDPNPADGQTATFSFDATDPGATDIDAGYIIPGAAINGLVFEDVNENGIQDFGEFGIPGVTVTLFDSNDMQVDQTMADFGGNYLFNNVLLGEYYIVFDPSTNDFFVPNYQGSPQDQGNNDTLDSDPDPTNGTTSNFTFDPANGNLTDIDAGYFEPAPTADLTGFVWHDLNKDGIRTNDEPGIAGATVELFTAAGVSQGTMTTDGIGNYTFANLMEADYYVVFDVSTNTANVAGYMPTLQNQGNDDAVDSDADPTNGRSDTFTFTVSSTPAVAAGYFLENGSVGDFVFVDYDQDGIQDQGEPGLGKIPVRLDGRDTNNNPIQRATETDPNGFYMFTNLPAGTYTITFTLPAIYGDMVEFTDQNIGNNDNVDSDPNANGVTASFTLNGGDNLMNWDAGIQDKDPPFVINPQGDVTLNCNDPQVDNPQQIFFEDNIDPTDIIDIQLTETIETTGGDPCTGGTIIVRTWVATDGSGNMATFTQRITTIDNEPPTLMFTHPDLAGVMDGDTIYTECTSELPFGREDVEATDRCSNVTIDFYDYVKTAGDCPTDGFIFEMVCTWTATDDCGNSAELEITVYFVDTEAPTLSGVPADITVDCGDVPAPPVVTASDSCDDFVPVTMMETRDPDTCQTYKIIRRWTATDDCGNQATDEQMITVEVDDLKIVGVPDDADVTCDEIPPVAEPMLLGNCYNPQLIFEETILGDTCKDYKIIRLWTGINDCGATVREVQSIFVTVPELEFENVPENITVDCDEIPDSVDPTLSHECYNPMIMFDEVVIGDTCKEYKIVRTWVGKNDCGQMVTATQTISVEIPPMEVEDKEDIMISCEEEVPPATDPEVTAKCFEYEITFLENREEGDCPDNYTLQRKWVVENSCGETETVEQTIEVKDTTKPELIISHPLLQNLEDGAVLMFGCKDDIPLILPEDATAEDNCDPNPIIEFTEEITNSANCIRDGYITEMVCGWIAIDRCGNSCKKQFTIIIKDDIDPEIQNCPDDIVINLFEGEEVPPIPTNVTATDDCGDVMLLFAESKVPNDDDCGFILTRTWTAMDNCGNVTECSQEIKANDVCDCPAILVDRVRSTNSDCGQNNGTITVETFGNEASFDYTLIPDNGTSNAAGNERYDLAPGTYLVLIYRASADDCIEKVYVNIEEANCLDTIQVTIPDLPTEICIEDAIFDFSGTITSTNICDAGNPAMVELTDVNQKCVGLTPMRGYEGTSPDLLCVVHCFNGDPNQCDTTFIRVTVEPENIVCDLQSTANIDDISCSGTPGNISISVSGNVGTLTYQWTPNVSSTNVASNLAAGNYQVVITDTDTDCNITEDYTIIEPSGSAITQNDLIITGITCPDNSNGDGGSISSATSRRFRVRGTDGTDYGLTPVTDLSAGKYEVSTEDGCNSSVIVDIKNPAPFQFSMSTTPESCAGNDGVISLTVMGGVGNLTYVWTPNVSTTNVASGLNSNTDYAVEITDERGCILTLTNLGINSNCTTSCTVNGGAIGTNDNPAICNKDLLSDVINISVGGNSGDYRFAITTTQGVILATFDNPQFDFADADAGTYLIYGVAFNSTLPGLINGANINQLSGCYDLSNELAITVLTSVECNQSNCTADGGTITTSGNLMPCTSDNDSDIISISASNTSGDYTYLLTDDDLVILALSDSPTFDFDGRAAGSYRIWGLAFDSSVTGAVVGGSTNNLAGCFDLSNAVTVTAIENCGGGGNTGNEVSMGLGATSGQVGDKVCIPLSVTDFTNISNFQFSIAYDASILTFTGAENITLPGYDAQRDFNLASLGFVTTAWVSEDAINGTTVLNSSTIVELCFDLIATGTSSIRIIGEPTPISVNNDQDEEIGLIGNEGQITVTDANGCIPLFNGETILTSVSDCGEDAVICLEVPLAALAPYDIFIDNKIYTQPLTGCQFDTILTYNTSQLLTNNTNTYRVDTWTVNGVTYGGNVDNALELAAALNDWDPTSDNWTYNGTTETITGGNPSSTYSSIELFIVADNAQISLGLTTNFLPQSTQLAVGVGTHTLRFTDNQNCEETVNLIVECRPNITKDTEEFTININEEGQFCIDTTQLPGTVNFIELECISTDDCEFVEFEEVEGCIEFVGVDVGSDTAQVVICDDLSFCDTTIIIVNSEFQQATPIAVADTVVTNQNVSKVIRVIDNDIILGEVTSLKLMETPDFGAAQVMSDNTINYTPQINYCGKDQMMYQVCNGAGCDEAMINISVDCGAVLIEPEPFTGFSPNGDGVNDFFTIKNIELIPDSELVVYNRQGLQVFKATPYRNNWSGKWGTLDLPDGTYFYVLKYQAGEVMTGYVVIAR